MIHRGERAAHQQDETERRHESTHPLQETGVAPGGNSCCCGGCACGTAAARCHRFGDRAGLRQPEATRQDGCGQRVEQRPCLAQLSQRALAWLAGGQVLLQRGALSRVYLAIEVGGEPFALLLPLAALLMLCAAGHILLSYLPLWLSFSTIRTPLHF